MYSLLLIFHDQKTNPKIQKIEIATDSSLSNDSLCLKTEDLKYVKRKKEKARKELHTLGIRNGFFEA